MISEFKKIDALSSSDFEVFVRDLFLASGWSEAVITKVGQEYKYGDGGVDIFAYKNKRKYAIEVKQRNLLYTVDVKALNQLVTGAKLANVRNLILVTNSYFTSEVKVRALRLGVELIDRDELQNLWVVKHSEIGRDIKPRKYQKQVIESAIEQYDSGKNKILIEMATGLGKTYTVAHLIKNLIQRADRRPKVLFLAHQVEILLQSVTAFKNVLGIGNYSFSACFSGSPPEQTDFVFASFDTLYGKINILNEDSFDFVIVDEAHHTPAKTYSTVVTLFKPKLLIGLTATPYRADNKSVIDFFGGPEGHIGKYDLIWALKHRKLAFPKYLVLLDDLDQEKIDQLERGLSISDLDKRLFLHKKDEEVIKIIEKTVSEKQIDNIKGIVFCRSISHMRHLIGFFQYGSATLVHSKMSDQERRENIRNFREGSYKYILVCDLFNEGIDIPETNLLVFMRYTGSKTIWLQQLGRGLRKTPNKDYVHVLDFVGSLERLNEVKQLTKQVHELALDKENLEDYHDSQDTPQILHNSSLEVKYSGEAAKVLELIESLRLQLNSRDSLIDKLRNYRKKSGSVPLFSEIELELEGVGCDQIATHFDSYLGYIKAALGNDVETESMINNIKEFTKIRTQENRIQPSKHAIALNFMTKQLYLHTEKEIELLVPDLDQYAQLFIKKPIQKEAQRPKSDNSKNPFERTCKVIEKYSKKVKTRADMKKLTEDERDDIINEYGSTSAFLKIIKELSRTHEN